MAIDSERDLALESTFCALAIQESIEIDTAMQNQNEKAFIEVLSQTITRHGRLSESALVLGLEYVGRDTQVFVVAWLRFRVASHRGLS